MPFPGPIPAMAAPDAPRDINARQPGFTIRSSPSPSRPSSRYPARPLARRIFTPQICVFARHFVAGAVFAGRLLPSPLPAALTTTRRPRLMVHRRQAAGKKPERATGLCRVAGGPRVPPRGRVQLGGLFCAPAHGTPRLNAGSGRATLEGATLFPGETRGAQQRLVRFTRYMQTSRPDHYVC